MVHKTPPKNFNPKFEVVSCYMESGDKILLLHRHNDKSQGGKWGVPAGKIDQGEDVVEAMIREAQEETGLALEPSKLEYLEKVFVRYPDYDFIYHMFRTKLAQQPAVTLSLTEHQTFQWVTPAEALQMDLVDDLDKCIEMSYSSTLLN